jgi:hypothetical protein
MDVSRLSGGARRDRMSGGARRDRTDDLLLAKQALSQLSYGPDASQRWQVSVGKSALASQRWQVSVGKSALASQYWLARRAVARGGWHRPPSLRYGAAAFAALRERRLVGLGRFELPTSRLSSARSNQLSYKPGTGVSNQQSVVRKFASI